MVESVTSNPRWPLSETAPFYAKILSPVQPNDTEEVERGAHGDDLHLP